MLSQGEETFQASPPAGVRPIRIALLIAILLGATLLRVHALGRTSYWYDEICSVLYARGQTAAIFAAPQGYFEHAPALASGPGTRSWRDVWFGFDTTPPLYASLLRLWWHLFGEGDIAGRALSVTLSVLTIAALFDVGRLIMSPSAALWACALCAASPPMVRYAQEARSYALLCLLGVLICDVALRLVRYGGSNGRYLLLGFLCGAALLTHYFILGGVAAVAVFLVLKLRGRTRIAVLCVIAAAFAVELWQLPVLLHHSQNMRQGIDWLAEPRAGLAANTFLRIAWLPVVYLILPPASPGVVSIPGLAIFILPIVLERRRPGLLLAGLWPIGIISLVAASDLWLDHGALLYVRYTLAASPMVFIAFAAVADVGGRWSRHLLPALAVAGALLAVPEAYSDQTWIKPESRELALDIQNQVEAGDVLVVASRPTMGLLAAGVEYLGIDFYAGPLPCAAAILEGPIDEATRQLIWSHKHVWVVKCFGGMTGNEVDGSDQYLGPCQLKTAGRMHLNAGRLYLAVPAK